MSVAIRENLKTLTFPPKAKSGGEREIFYPESDGKPMGETDYHLKVIMLLHQTLELFFKNIPDVRIFSDIMFYYEQGNPRKVFAPDVMFVRGVGKHLRRTFKLWEEKIPEVIFEISSRGTWKEDLQKKYFLYQEIGVKEYYIFDPEYDYLPDTPFVAYHLKNGAFAEVKIKRGRIFSPALNLEIVNTNKSLRLFNPETKSFLPTMDELNEKAAKAERLQSEVEKLKAELAKLKRRN